MDHRAVARIFARRKRYERVLIEVGGTTNPARLARHFGLLPGQPETFSPWAELHQIICVVDALDFYRTLVRSLRRVARVVLWDFQNEQIAGASLLVLNKCDPGRRHAERDLCLRSLQATCGR